MTVTSPTGTLNTYATPSLAVDVADALGVVPTLYFTVPAGLVVTVAPDTVLPRQSFTITPMNPLVPDCVTLTRPPRKPISALVGMRTFVVRFSRSGRAGYA